MRNIFIKGLILITVTFPEMAEGKSEMGATNSNKEKLMQDFTLKILKAEEGNQIFSPINIAHAFGILLYGAEGDTKKEIANILGYGEFQGLQQEEKLKIVNIQWSSKVLIFQLSSAQ